MKKQTRTQTLRLAIGTAVAGTFALAPAVQAADNPFGLQKLDGGYQLAAADKAKEGKCGGDKKADGKCGGDKKADGKCGGDKKADGKCGGDKKKDGKCGEGKCGGDKKK